MVIKILISIYPYLKWIASTSFSKILNGYGFSMLVAWLLHYTQHLFSAIVILIMGGGMTLLWLARIISKLITHG